jgi:phosphohistidine swiveling domain-containing protein
MVRFGRSRPRAVIPLADPAVATGSRRDTQLGTLARVLVHAERLGATVPRTFVVTADLFRQVAHTQLPPGHDAASLLRTAQRPTGIERAARARERLLSVFLESDVEREIDAAFAELGESAPWGVAVRTSPVLEDQGVARAAGLSHTELGVRTREELGAAIRRAWARVASEATIDYLRARKARDLAVAVVLQPVVAASASAVLLTDTRVLSIPTSIEAASRPERRAVALFGLITDRADLATAEVVAFAADGAIIAQRPSAQKRQYVVGEGGLAEVEAPPAPVLSPARLASLVELATRLEALGPSAVACVVPEEGEPSVVDVVPLEHEGYPGAGGPATFWARAAVDEVIATPLTPLSAHLLRQPLLSRGRLSYGDDAPRQARLSGVLASIEGRPYLDVSPLLEPQAERGPLDRMSRVELGSSQWAPELAGEPSARPSLARAGLRIAQIATEQKTLTDHVVRFERDAEQQRRWLSELDLGILPDDSLTTTLHEVAQFLSGAHRLHASACALSVTGNGLLTSILSGVDAGRAPWLSHAVSAGAGVVTARPAAAFSHVAGIARFDAAALPIVQGGAARALGDLPDGPLLRALRQFLDAYGDRGLNEAELATARWGENTAPLFFMLGAALRGDAVDPDVAASRARALADRQLALLEPGLSFFETRLVRDVSSRQRELLRLRERCRARIAHGQSMMRVVALDVDRRIRRLDPTLEPGSALFLTLKELTGAVAKYRTDLAPIVRARRADHAARNRAREPVPVFRGAPKPAYPSAVSGILPGIALAAGAAKGRVVRLGAGLEGLGTFAPGDVLVVPALDLGLSPLFLLASAVVTELGTPLASSAVVARDCGVPAVTLGAATLLLRDGMEVRVDGDAGTVELPPP